MPPDYQEDVRTVHQDFPSLLQWNSRASCGEFLQRVARYINDKYGLWGTAGEVGLLTKPNPGSLTPNGFTWPSEPPFSGRKTSVDYIAWRDGNRVDVIQAAGAHPAPAGPTWNPTPEFDDVGNPQWRSTDVFLGIRDWPLYNSDAPDEVETSVAELGRSWFCYFRALMDWLDEANRNFLFWTREEGGDYLRVMAAVEGLHHVRPGTPNHGMPDPWAEAAVLITDPRYDDAFKRGIDMLGAAGRRAWITVYGGRYQTQSHDSRRAFHDRLVGLLHGRWQAVRGFEMMNEYLVNGWTEEQVIEAGRDLQGKVPSGIPLALSSPHAAHSGGAGTTNEQMKEAMDALYGHGVGNRMTIHRDRDQRSKWHDPFAYNAFYRDLPKEDNEPLGQGASAGGSVTDAGFLVGQYDQVSRAGWSGHCAHNAWGVWNGHMPQAWLDRLSVHHRVRFLDAQENQSAVSRALGAYRRGGRVVPGEPPEPPPEPVRPPVGAGVLLPGQRLLPGETLASPAGRARLHYQADGNLVVYLDGIARWASGTEGTEPSRLEMQAEDGNLVLYDVHGPIRSTRTGGHPGAMVQLQDDGNFVVYEDPNGPRAGNALWASATSEFYS